jgi:hypothetical protein
VENLVSQIPPANFLKFPILLMAGLLCSPSLHPTVAPSTLLAGQVGQRVTVEGQVGSSFTPCHSRGSCSYSARLLCQPCLQASHPNLRRPRHQGVMAPLCLITLRAPSLLGPPCFKQGRSQFAKPLGGLLDWDGCK